MNTTTALAPLSQFAAPTAWDLARHIANTPFVPGALRGRPEAVLACVLYGQELGLGPMQSLASIHVIDGRPAAAPEMMRALINRAGHRLDIATTDQSVTIAGTRADTNATATVTWTMADAQRAGLVGKGAWKTYPRAMLLARATSEIARMLFPDVIAGLSYTPEEVASVAGLGWDPQHGVIEEQDDPARVTFARLRTIVGTPAAEVVRGYAGSEGGRLTEAAFAADPDWRARIDQLLDDLTSGVDQSAGVPDPADVIDVEFDEVTP